MRHDPLMQNALFETAVANIVRQDSRFDPLAYFFLKDSLDFTLKRFNENHDGPPRHVSGRDLARGFRDLALNEFGPMASTLMSEWNVRETRDIGEMVFQLIDQKMFGKQDSDTLEDFEDLYDFDEAFAAPFRPTKRPRTGRPARAECSGNADAEKETSG